MSNDPKDHPFRGFVHDMQHCMKCNAPEAAHTSTAACEVCGCTGKPLSVFRTMLMCPSCRESEQTLDAANRLEAEQRVEEAKESFVHRQAEEMKAQLDKTITIRTEFFNADLPSIMDIKRDVEENMLIPADQKYFETVKAVRTRFDQFKVVLFELKDVEAQINSSLHAMQSYMNDLANNLKAEERAKLHLENINYKPVSPKAPTTAKVKAPKVPAAPKAKIDKNMLRAMALALNLPEMVIQITCVSKNMTVEQACEHLQTIGAVKAGIPAKEN